MRIVSVIDKRVKAIVENPGAKSVKGLDKGVVRKIADMVVAIQAANHPRQLQSVPKWRAHELAPQYPGKWSLTVTGNYRLTFHFDASAITASSLDYEDYH